MHFIQLKIKIIFTAELFASKLRIFLNDLINFVIVVQLADFAFKKKKELICNLIEIKSEFYTHL